MTKEHLEIFARTAAKEHDLDPVLVCSVVDCESGWNTWLSRYEPDFYSRYVDIEKTREQASRFVKNCPFVVSFQTELRERSFSRGLMQVMGQTAREHGFLEPIPQLHDPKTGLDVGCYVLKRKLIASNGELERALLRWNGGGDPDYPKRIFARMPFYGGAK